MPQTKQPPTKILHVLDDRTDLSAWENKIFSLPAQTEGQFIFLLTDQVKADFMSRQTLQIGTGASVNIYYCYFGQYNVNVSLKIKLAQNSRVNYQSIFLAAQQQQFNFQEKYIFQSTDSFGRFNLRGLVKDQAAAVSDGNIVILPGAQGSDAYLDMQAVILDKTAKAKVIPGLQIQANSVKASHSARVSALDDDQLFYLRSRGLTADQARKLFIHGLLGEAVSKIPDRKIQQQVLASIKNNLDESR